MIALTVMSLACEMTYSIWLSHLHLSRDFSAECMLAAVQEGDWEKAVNAHTSLGAIDKLILKIMDGRGKHVPKQALIGAYWPGPN